MANLHCCGLHFVSTILCAAALVLPAGCGEGDSSGVGVSPQVCSTSSAVSAGESAMMEPGGDCIGCHSGGEGPAFTAETSCNACHTAGGANGAPGRIVAP
jgi:hypothetical protein